MTFNGIDISKDNCESAIASVCLGIGKGVRRFDNNKKGFKLLLKHLAKETTVIMEAIANQQLVPF